MSLSVMDAAQRAYLSYKAPKKLGAVAYKIGNVLAYLQADKTLVIVGTNDRADWRDNFDIWAVKGSYHGAMNPPVPAAKWHSGFLWHARQVVYAMTLYKQKPKYVVGHSLGGAAAQIVASHYQIPGITFGAPKAMFGATLAHHTFLNVIYEKDLVPDWPETSGNYQRIGKTEIISDDGVENWPYHRMQYYLGRTQRGIENGEVSARWPG